MYEHLPSRVHSAIRGHFGAHYRGSGTSGPLSVQVDSRALDWITMGGSMIEPILKPKDAIRANGRKAVIHIFTDGREVIRLKAFSGKRMYKERVETMRLRQGERCCLEGYAPMCTGYLRKDEATFEHENGKGMGGSKRDDRIELPDGTWINGAAHEPCNIWKASRFIGYNRNFQK